MSLFTKSIEQRHEEELRKWSFIRFFEGLLLGLSIGSLIGLLAAPKSGKETIVDIKSKSSELKDEAIKKGKKIVPKIKNKTEEIEENIEDAADEVAEKAEEVAEEL
ncbi:MAG TPA: YtxH domain-containing protein [Clostridia bacterium]|nr:YtxH domain-containing protein [Clostridia bacterium]